MVNSLQAFRAAVVGGGPAGLMAVEALLSRGVGVDLFDAMPSLGRKFLMAGKSGLNLTHSEDEAAFLDRFGLSRSRLEPALAAFGAAAIRAWAADLGIETFIGSSGRIFPVDFKAAPLLRAWLRKLRAAGATIHVRHKWCGWTESGGLRFETPTGKVSHECDATVLALGGGSWPALGSDGAWMPLLEASGAGIVPLKPANCGFDVVWSAHFRDRFSGQPVKPVTLTFGGMEVSGEFVVTRDGVEGSAIYALSVALRDAIAAEGTATLSLDLHPDRDLTRLVADLSKSRGSRSMATHLRRTTGLRGVRAGLLREFSDADIFGDPSRLAHAIKNVPLQLSAVRPLAEAISSAGGLAFESLGDDLMLRTRPGTFCAGEMLDWEAPTGGYLLSGCFALGHSAGNAAADWLQRSDTV